MNALLLAAATALSMSLAAPAQAQDHSGHGAAVPAPAPPPAEPAVDHATMDHSHGLETAELGPEPGEQAMDHAAMGHAAPQGPVEGSGTSRLPQAGGTMPGLHFDLGGGWTGMAHGYAWGVYTDQTGPRGDDMAFVQSMAMLTAEKPFDGGRLQL